MSPRALVLVLVYLFLWELAPSTNHHRYYESDDSPVVTDDDYQPTTTTVVTAEITYENVPDGTCHEDDDCWEDR